MLTAVKGAMLEEAISSTQNKPQDCLGDIVTHAFSVTIESVNDSIKKLQRDLSTHMDTVRGLLSKVDRP